MQSEVKLAVDDSGSRTNCSRKIRTERKVSY